MSQLDLRLCIIFYILLITSEFCCLESNVELLQYPPASEVIKGYENKIDDADTENDIDHNDVTADETNILSIDYDNVKVEGNNNVTSVDANYFINVQAVNESNDSRKVIANDQDTVSVYIAGSDDSIKNLKENIQKCGEGHELLVYFYIYKNQKYYDLGYLYTDANILRRFIINCNNYFCIKTPSNKWCFDHLSKYNKDHTEAGFDLNEPVRFDSNNVCKLQEYLPIEVAGHYEFNLPNGKEYKGKDILNKVYQNAGFDVINNNQNIINQGSILTPEKNYNNGISLTNEDNEITNMELGINDRTNDLQDITKLRESLKIDDTFMNINDFTITGKGENKNPIKGGIEISLDDIKQNEFIADKANHITINGNDAKIKTKNDINSNNIHMLSKPRTVLGNLLGKKDQSYLPLYSVESPILPNPIPYKDVIKTPLNINIQSPFEAVVGSESNQAFNILQDNNQNNAEELKSMSHTPNEQVLLNNNLNTDLSRTKFFIQDPCTYKNLKLLHSNKNSFSSGNDNIPINNVEDTKIQSVETSHTRDITKGSFKNNFHPHINVVSSTYPHDTYQQTIDVKSSTSSDTIDLDNSNIDNRADIYQPYELNYKEEIPQNNALPMSNINETAILTVNNKMGLNTPNLPTSYHSHGDVSYKFMNPNLKTIIMKNGINKGNQDILSPEVNPVRRENSIYPFNDLPQYKLSYLQIPLVSAYIPLKLNKSPNSCLKHQGENIKASNSKANLLEMGENKELPIFCVSRDAPYQYSNVKNIDHQLKYNPAISKNIITLNEQDKTYITPPIITEPSINLGIPEDSFILNPSSKVSVNNVDLVPPSLPNENLENSMYSIDASKSNTEPLTYPTESNSSYMKYQTIDPGNNDNDSTLLNRIPVLSHNTVYTIPKPNTPMYKMQNIPISYVPITPSYQTTPIQNLNSHGTPKAYANSFMTKTEEEIKKVDLESKRPNMINFYNKNIQSWLKGFPMYQLPGQRILNYNEVMSSAQDYPKLSSKIQNVPDYTVGEENDQLDYTELAPQAINSQTMPPGFVLNDNKNNIKNQVSPDYSALKQNPKYNFGDFYKLQPKYFKIPSPYVPVTTGYLQPRPNIRYSPLKAIKLLPIEQYSTNLKEATIHVNPLNEMSTEVQHVQPLSILRNIAHAIPNQNIIPKFSNYLPVSSNLPSIPIYQSNSIPIQSVQNTYLNGLNNKHLQHNQNTLTNGFRTASTPESVRAEIESTINKNIIDLNENYIDNGLKGQTLQQPAKVKYDERISPIGVNPTLYSLKQRLPEYLRIKNIEPVEKNPTFKSIYSPDINKHSMQDSVIYYDEESNIHKLNAPVSSSDEKLFSNVHPQKLPERKVQENHGLKAKIKNMVEYQVKTLNILDQDQYNMNPFIAPKLKQNYIVTPSQLVNQKYLGLLQQQQSNPTSLGTIFPNSLITKIKSPSYLQHQDNLTPFTPYLTEFKKPQIPYLSKGTQYLNIYNSLKPVFYKTVDPDMKQYDITSTPTIYENIHEGISTVGPGKGTNIKESLNMNGPSNYLYFNQPITDSRKTLDSVSRDISEQNTKNNLDSSFDLKGQVYESSNPENPTISSSSNILPEETLTTATIKDRHKNINPNIINTPIKYNMYWPVKFKNHLNLAKNIAVHPESEPSSITQPSATFYTPYMNPTYKPQTVYTEVPTPPSNRINLSPNNLSPAEIYYENFSRDSNHQENNVLIQQPSPILLSTKPSNQNIPIYNLHNRLISANYLTSPVTSINPMSAHNYLNGYTFNMINPNNIHSNKSKQDIFSIPFNGNYISYGLDNNLSYSFKQEKPFSTVTSGNPTVNPFSNGRSYFTEYTPIPQSASSALAFDSQFTKTNKNPIETFFSSTPKSINNFVPIKSITESTNPLTDSSRIKSDRLLQNINSYNTITQNTGAFQTNAFPMLLPPSIRQTNLDSVPKIQSGISFAKRAPILPLLDFSSENEPHSSISNKTSPAKPNIGLANFGTSYSLQGEYSVPQINSHAYSISENIPERFEVHKKSYPTQIEPISTYSPARFYQNAFNIADKNYYSAISDNNNLQSRFSTDTHNGILSQIKNLSPKYVSYKTMKPYLNGQFADLNYAFTLKTKPSVDISNTDTNNQIYQIISPSTLNLSPRSSFTNPIASSTLYKTPSLDASKIMIENSRIQNINNKKNTILPSNLLNVQSDNILSTFNPKSMNNAGVEYILLQPQREITSSTPTELITRIRIDQNQPEWQTPLVIPSQSPWSKITSQPCSYPPNQWDSHTKSDNFDPLTQYTNPSYIEASRNNIWDYILKQHPVNYAASPGPFLVTQSHGQPDNQQDLKYDLKEYKPASLTSNIPMTMINQNTDNLKSIINFENENAFQQLQKRIEYYLPTSLASIGNKELETQLNDYNLKDVQSWSPNIVIAKYEPSLGDSFVVKTDDSGVELKAWRSKIKVFKPRIVYDVKEVSSLNFMPVVLNSKYTVETAMELARGYVTRTYGNPIVIKGVYSFWKPYAMINYNSNIIRNDMPLLWPTFCSCGCCKSGCNCINK